MEYGPCALAASRLLLLPDCPLLVENVGPEALDGVLHLAREFARAHAK